ncbi:MAG: ATP-binding cassette domain-containing protein, partial [Bauldia sp.]
MTDDRQTMTAERAAADAAPLLEMRHISKHFAGVRALVDAHLSVVAGEVHAVMGENGAGKSTLIKILAGAYAADQGQVFIAGKPVRLNSPTAAMAMGIAVIYQELSLSPNLTVAENIYLGREIRRGLSADRKAMEARCGGILESLGAAFSSAD